MTTAAPTQETSLIFVLLLRATASSLAHVLSLDTPWRKQTQVSIQNTRIMSSIHHIKNMTTHSDIITTIWYARASKRYNRRRKHVEYPHSLDLGQEIDATKLTNTSHHTTPHTTANVTSSPQRVCDREVDTNCKDYYWITGTIGSYYQTNQSKIVNN